MSRSQRRSGAAVPPGPAHGDPGLQPERTTLAWGRTVLALVTAAAICLRWISHHGSFVLVLFTLAVGAAAAIYLGQRARYSRSSAGITAEQVAPSCLGVFSLATAAVALGALGVFVVLVLA